MKEQLKETLEILGIDLNKEIIEQSTGSCNQVICRGDHPFCGYSIRDLLKIWQHLTGQQFKETADEYDKA